MLMQLYKYNITTLYFVFKVRNHNTVLHKTVTVFYVNNAIYSCFDPLFRPEHFMQLTLSICVHLCVCVCVCVCVWGGWAQTRHTMASRFDLYSLSEYEFLISTIQFLLVKMLVLDIRHSISTSNIGYFGYQQFNFH